MGEGFTPAEKIVAQENKDKRDKGLEVAKTYRVFLGKFKDNVLFALSDKHEDLSQFSDIKTLKELGITSQNIDLQVFRAIQETNSETNAKLNLVDILPDGGSQILSMTPKEFLEYIDSLNKQLIK
ncbi:MAG: hypothetical protein AAB438_03935 [Patescibacteria group bacterium]